MSFVHRQPEVEAWLDAASESWSLLSRAEYVAAWSRWRRTFEARLWPARPAARSERAVHLFEALLPCEVFVWNTPGYPQHPTPPAHDVSLFAYRATELTSLESVLLECLDAVVVDAQFRGTCVFSHEGSHVGTPCFLRADPIPGSGDPEA